MTGMAVVAVGASTKPRADTASPSSLSTSPCSVAPVPPTPDTLTDVSTGSPAGGSLISPLRAKENQIPASTPRQSVADPTCVGTRVFVADSVRPVRPSASLPHVHSVPSAFVAMEWNMAALTVCQVVSVPMRVGVVRATVLLLPRSP